MGDLALFVFGVFFERVAHVGVGYFGILPQETNDSVGGKGGSVEVLGIDRIIVGLDYRNRLGEWYILSTAARGEVVVMYGGHAPYCVVGWRGAADLGGCRHCQRCAV